MIEDILSFLSSALSGNPALAILASFGWGLASVIFSPCHLSSIPLIIGYMNSGEIKTQKRIFILSLVFSLGILFSIAFIGAFTFSAGRMLGNLGPAGNYIAAFVFFVFGLYLMDVIPLNWSGLSLKAPRKKGLLPSFFIGFLFGIGLGPCTFAFLAPVLGIVMRGAAKNPAAASLMLLAYGLGHCTVITGAGTLSGAVQKFLNRNEKSKAVIYLKRACGLLVILGGVYFIVSSL